MAKSQKLRRASRILESGGVIAYPTEGVFGLGCLADHLPAVSRILAIKSRDPAMGLVVIISDPVQIASWVDIPLADLSLPSSDEKPTTWVVPASDEAPWWICGEHPGIAIRQTTHPVARALCESVDAALVSTSANISGHPPARNRFVLRRVFGSLVDCIVPGDCGPAVNPSEIRHITSGKILRPA
jgi:L-threonylcarbamoyladenylate synthase